MSSNDDEHSELDETEDIEIPLSNDLLPEIAMEDDGENEYVLILRRTRGGKQLDIHHITPRSRGGKDTKDNLTIWRRKFHTAWHQLFGNLTLIEIHRFIDIINAPGEVWRREDFNMLRDRLLAEAKTKRRTRRPRKT